MEFDLKLEKEDWKQYQKRLENKYGIGGQTGVIKMLRNILLWAILSFVFFTLMQDLDKNERLIIVLTTVFWLAVFGLVLWNSFVLRSKFLPMDDGVVTGFVHYKITDEGIFSTSDNFETICRWSAVKELERKNGLILIYMDRVQAFIFPEEKMQDADKFHAYLQMKYTAAA